MLYHWGLLTVNERIKQVRERRKLTSKGLALIAGVSPSEVSLLERKMRQPKTDTLQKIAAALEVSTSYLLGEVNADLPVEEALSRESFQIFVRDAKPVPDEVRRLREIAETQSAPQTVRGWHDLVANLDLYRTIIGAGNR